MRSALIVILLLSLYPAKIIAETKDPIEELLNSSGAIFLSEANKMPAYT